MKAIVWWFTRGAASLITIPIFLLLVLEMVGVFYQGVLQTIVYVKVLIAVWGWLGGVACLFIWPFSAIMPGLMIFAAITETPRLMEQREIRGVFPSVVRFVLGLIFLVGVASLVQWGHGHVISWIADRNPDAAYNAGVTGSKPPSWYKP
jgi:hypothetical protein